MTTDDQGRIKVSREEAKDLVDEHQWGTLIVADVEKKRVIGTVPEEEREYDSHLTTYVFGEMGSYDD